MKSIHTVTIGIFFLCVLADASVELNTARIAYYNLRDFERAKNACLQTFSLNRLVHWHPDHPHLVDLTKLASGRSRRARHAG